MDMFLFKMHPENIGIQLASRSLIFYKSFNCYKKLIDEVDLLSPKHCALITPYQYLQPPGSGLFLSIDAHKSEIKTVLIDTNFLFTCSDVMNVLCLPRLKVLGENKYPSLIGFENQVEKVEMTRVYFNTSPDKNYESISEFDGGFLIIGQSVLMSLRFDNHIFFERKFSNSLKNIFLLPKKYVLVQFNEQNYFEIYNILTGELVSTQTFQTKIKFILCSINNNFPVLINKLRNSELLIVLEKGEFQKFSLVSADVLDIKRIYNIQPGGIECNDCCFLCSDDQDSAYESRFIAFTYVDGSICLLDDDGDDDKIRYLSPKIKDKSKIDPLKIIVFDNTYILLIGESGSLYFWKYKIDKKIKTILGRFQFAKITNDGFLVASSFGNVYCYIIENKLTNNEEMHQIYLYAKFAAHSDEITCLELSRNINR